MIFVKLVQHSDVAKSFRTIKSVRLCKIGVKKKDFKIKYFGESSTLKSNPIKDEETIRQFLFESTPIKKLSVIIL